MIRKKMYKQIQTFKRQGYSKGKIAITLGMDPKTVAKYYHMDEKDFRCYRQQHMFRDKMLEGYEEDILEVYEKNEFKRLNMSAVYDYLEERPPIESVCAARRDILKRDLYNYKGIQMVDLVHASRGCRYNCYPCAVAYLGELFEAVAQNSVVFNTRSCWYSHND